MTERIVRAAAADDVDALVDLRALMFSAMGVKEREPTWRVNARAWFAARLEDPQYKIAVVEVDAVVVACAMGAIRDAAPSPGVPDGGDILVSNVCTFPEARGQGHARAAFDAVMDWARKTGTGRAELMTTPEGQGMYARAGFGITSFPAMRADLTG